MESSNSEGSFKKGMKLTLIKTEIKNKYVVEAYERLKEHKSLKQLLFSCLCGMGKFTSYFINEENVFKGVMDVMKIVQKLQNEKEKFHGHVTVPELDRFMNSYFQFWIEEEDRSKPRVKIAKSTIVNKKSEGKDAEQFMNLHSNKGQNEMLKREPLFPGVLCKKSADNRKPHVKLIPVLRNRPKNSAVSRCRENTGSYDETLENEQIKIAGLDLPELQSRKIRNSYVLETFRFKNGDSSKIYNCLCEWEGITPEVVHLENFAAAVKNTIRKADKLRRTKSNLYDSFLMEFFKFPLVERKKESRKMEAKEKEKTEEKNKRTSTETQTQINDKVKKRKRKINHDTTAVKRQKNNKEGTMKQKVKNSKIKKADEKKSDIRSARKCRTKPKNSDLVKKRNCVQKRKWKRIDVLELQLKMKLQHQTKLHQKIKRQNNLLVRQRKHIRVLKQKLAGACSGGICKGVQCSLISATPQTLLVRVMKP
ncbi:uncharacterized protein LOC133184732 [Saccostrea echinata]|uniref:uncharacterized protein LOC133184732 n=1 Tax=Saccostrea echinata TaxID=191078 RepID=UPI002A7F27D4|nr:uncharacterized protein LOC133184732 [Saccostrea echinata]